MSGFLENNKSIYIFIWLLLLLFNRWKGSIYKLVWMDLTAYLIIYFGINCIYRFVLEDVQKRYNFFSNNFHKLINSINKTIYLSSKSRDFEKAAMFCENNSSLIPLTFVLAFYVSHVVSRWWAQWNAIPWPDGLAFKINSYCSGLVCLIEEKKW